MKTTIKGYEVKNLKTGVGHDLAGYTCSLYKDDEKIGTVNNDGYGGGFQYFWRNKEFEKETEKFIKREKAFVPKTDFEKKYGLMFELDIFIDELMTKKERVLHFKKICKKDIAFQVGEHIGTENYYQYKNKIYTPAIADKVKEAIKKAYPNKDFIIINEELAKGVPK